MNDLASYKTNDNFPNDLQSRKVNHGQMIEIDRGQDMNEDKEYIKFPLVVSCINLVITQLQEENSVREVE